MSQTEHGLSDEQLSEALEQTAIILLRKVELGENIDTVKDGMRDEFMGYFSHLDEASLEALLVKYDNHLEVAIECERNKAPILKVIDRDEVKRRAREFAEEVTVLARTGGDATGRLQEIDLENYHYGMALRKQDQDEFFELNKTVFLGVMKRNSETPPSRAISQQHATRKSSGQSLSALAVNTAVRATVWESVRAIFRAFK
jgi:hypothetical protein